MVVHTPPAVVQRPTGWAVSKVKEPLSYYFFFCICFLFDKTALTYLSCSVSFLIGVSNTAFSQLMEFTYTATLAVAGEEEAYDVWKAAEYLQMQEAIKALNNK